MNIKYLLDQTSHEYILFNFEFKVQLPMNIPGIQAALQKVVDPNSSKSIVEYGMVEDIKIKDNDVYFMLKVGHLDASSKANLNFACTQAIQNAYKDASVHAHMMNEIPEGVKRSEASGGNGKIKNIIAVASGKGGVGKSTVSVNLALALRQTGAKVGLLDADLYGPSIPTMLGLKGQRPRVLEVDGKNMIEPLEALDIHVMSIGFIIEPEQAVVLRGPRLGGIVKQFFQDCLWPDLDYLIVDLPPGTGDIQLTMVQTVSVTGAVLVTTPQRVAIADAIKAMNMFRLDNIKVPILGVIENMSWFSPEELPDNKYYIFGSGGGAQLAEKAESQLLGQVPLIQSVREAGDVGRPPVLAQGSAIQTIFKDLAERLIVQVRIRNRIQEPTKKVEIKT